ASTTRKTDGRGISSQIANFCAQKTRPPWPSRLDPVCRTLREPRHAHAGRGRHVLAASTSGIRTSKRPHRHTDVRHHRVAMRYVRYPPQEGMAGDGTDRFEPLQPLLTFRARLRWAAAVVSRRGG